MKITITKAQAEKIADDRRGGDGGHGAVRAAVPADEGSGEVTRPRPAVQCPTCGHTWPVAPPLDDARRRAHQAALRKAMERRAAVVQVTVWPKVPELFTARQVGEGCRAAGRHWSEHQAVIGRADRLGLIVRVARVKLASQRDTQLWRQTQALLKVHKLALKVKRTNEKGLTRKRR